MKLGRGTRPAFLLFHFAGSELVPALRGAADARFEDFVAALRPTEACYGVVGIEYRLVSGATRSKLVFVSWIPAGCPKAEVRLVCVLLPAHRCDRR